MCRQNSINQIQASLQQLKNAQSKSELFFSQGQATAFIHVAYEAEHINEKEKISYESKMRRIYRKQIIGEGA